MSAACKVHVVSLDPEVHEVVNVVSLDPTSAKLALPLTYVYWALLRENRPLVGVYRASMCGLQHRRCMCGLCLQSRPHFC